MGSLRTSSGKAETWRLGNENNEDALSWNVFVSLQDAGLLGLAAQVLADCQAGTEPDLYLWGKRIGQDRLLSWPRLQRIRDELEPQDPATTKRRQQTEPDVVLHVRGWGWIFIEAKLSSPTHVYRLDRREEWIGRYSTPCPNLFDEETIRSRALSTFPEQLLRNVAFAHCLAKAGDKATVVALVRERDRTAIEEWAGGCMMSDAPVRVVRRSWESLHAALPADAKVGRLRNYLEDKSVNLRRAFSI
jgi:Restriction Endonuclease associating with ARP